MPLSCTDLSSRLWGGKSKLNIVSTLAIVPVLNIAAVRESGAASLDLRLGRWFRAMRQSKITEVRAGEDQNESFISKEQYVRFGESFILHPNQFVVGGTLEWIRMPLNLSGYAGKSAWGRRGLIIETAAGIHPGFTGCLTLELANVGTAPIALNPGMPVCQIFFHRVEGVDQPAATQFVGHRKPGLGTIKKDKILLALEKPFFRRA